MSEEVDEDIFDTDPTPSSIILIYDNRSTECRCIKIVLEILKLEFQIKPYNRESNEFNLKSLNPRENLPILIDGQFSIAERFETFNIKHSYIFYKQLFSINDVFIKI